MKRALTGSALGAAALLVANCAPSTPQTRIDRNYSLYESLPEKHQKLVSEGRIAKGMSKPAVFMALGHPSRKTEGYRDEARFERWDYTRLRPVYHHSFYGHYGHGWGHYGHHHYGCYGWGPTVEYVPYRSSSVIFRRGVVDAWERLSPSFY